MCLLITYLQTAQAFDNALKGTFFPESSDQTYLIVIGIIVTCIYLFGSLANRKVQLPEDIYEKCKRYDPMGVFFYIVILGLYIISYWLFVELLEIYTAGMIVIFGTLVINFVILLPIILVTRSKLLSKDERNVNTRVGRDREDHNLRQMFRMPKYWLLLVSTLCVVGAAYSYQEQ